jgi:hypothetical protein
MVNTCEVVTGRLLEIRVAAGYKTVADVDHMIDMIRRNMAKLQNEEKMVIVADWRPVTVMPPETAVRAREMLAGVNPRVTRSAILSQPEDSTKNLQVVRLIREAENPARRHFTEPAALAAWLSQVLTVDETERLRAFLSLR